MKKSPHYEYQASANDDGQFECRSYTQIDSAEQQSSHFSKDNGSAQHAQANHSTGGQYGHADEIFKQSYQSRFNAQHADYVDKMREQFEQMRQSMLDQLESYTRVKNIRR